MNNNDQAILTDAGRFGLGTISPVATLHVEGTISQTGIEQPNIKPVVDFNFAATKVLDHRIDFRRNSVGTYHDSLEEFSMLLKTLQDLIMIQQLVRVLGYWLRSPDRII